MITDQQIVQVFAETVSAAIWLWAAYRRVFSRKPMPFLLAIPGRFFKLCLLLVTLGLLAGCAGSDPLAVASGPLFPLNPGHWQPTPQDLAAPPPVVNR
jgi:hypothetical protein